MKLRILLGALIIIFALAAGLEADDIYQWVDKDGVLHFTDGPPPPGAERVEGLSETPPGAPRPEVEPAQPDQAGAVEQGGTPPAEAEDAGPPGEDDNRSTYRDDYWRRMGWGNDASQAEGPGPAPEGENPPPPDQENTGAIDGGETPPAERKAD